MAHSADRPPFRPAIRPDARPAAGDLLLLFANDRVVVRSHGEGLALPVAGDLPHLADLAFQLLGHHGDLPCFGAELPTQDLSAGGPWRLEKLRSLWGKVDDAVFATAGFAFQIVHWASTHRFCGRCGTPTEASGRERSRTCPSCGLVAYPRLSPVVIAVVRDGDRLLLAKPQRAVYNFYSALAGFVEPGESLEEALRREIREEANIEIENIRYFGSQPWPYPHQLMIGFHADYAGGELRFDPEEIAEGDFYPVDALPPLPSPLSIARHLIDHAIARAGGR